MSDNEVLHGGLRGAQAPVPLAWGAKVASSHQLLPLLATPNEHTVALCLALYHTVFTISIQVNQK